MGTLLVGVLGLQAVLGVYLFLCKRSEPAGNDEESSTRYWAVVLLVPSLLIAIGGLMMVWMNPITDEVNPPGHGFGKGLIILGILLGLAAIRLYRNASQNGQR
ncbi:hypothetical protein [Pseudomonas sp. P9(2020)]|uniref:hypothetical protein n=1 Tax=Pseudomonas sp. P9(2020) TaxID=2763316 RepID=UPI001B326FD2|nr:hypothetical protein [Pseudomonas sp. P9(2020)]MBP5947886.1 hypothetical protein [Pseudomonas sp. P9(2020)]